MPGSSKLPECELVVIFVVKYIHKGCKKRVEVLRKNIRWCSQTKTWTYIEDREFRENSTKLLVKRVLCEFDLSHIKIAYATDFEVFVDYLEHCQMLDTMHMGSIQSAFFVESWTERCPRNLLPLVLEQLLSDHSSTS